MKGPLEKTG